MKEDLSEQKVQYLRQLDIWNPDVASPETTIVGSGSIGSFSALALSKMGIKRIVLWDPDRIAMHNISNQFFRKKDLGNTKVDATAILCKEFAPEDVAFKTIAGEFTDEAEINTEIAVVVTDNIESRKLVYLAAKKSDFNLFFIDGRMGAELLHIFAFPTHESNAEKQMKKYEDNYLDHPNDELPCTARTILYNVLVISWLIGSIVKKYACKEKIPFHIIFDLKTMQYIVDW